MLLPETFVTVFLPIAALVLGCCVGSFLNVVIYRLPNDLSVNEPKRSFCPNCKYDIPWYQNLPILSWLLLRGKCASCKQSISPRYLMVEALTGICFLAIWKTFAVDYETVKASLSSLPPEERTMLSLLKAMGPSVGHVLALWILFSLLISATFIDFDHFIIPDGINFGGIVVGLVMSTLLPMQLMGEELWYRGLWMSLVGAATGYALLWTVVRLGKMAFGKLKYDFEEPTAWTVHQPEGADEPMICIGDEETPWTEALYRSSDRLLVECTELQVNGEKVDAGKLVAYVDRFELPDGITLPLEDVQETSGKCTSAVVPREAMGEGDVKFIAMIGAFLGWQAVLFTVFAASIVGAIVGLVQKAVSKEEWKRPIPFGPYLTLGAVLWVFAGVPLMVWTFGLFGFGRDH